jgi:hypothetical protein
MLILNFTYPLRCFRVPPVEYHCSRRFTPGKMQFVGTNRGGCVCPIAAMYVMQKRNSCPCWESKPSYPDRRQLLCM